MDVASVEAGSRQLIRNYLPHVEPERRLAIDGRQDDTRNAERRLERLIGREPARNVVLRVPPAQELVPQLRANPVAARPDAGTDGGHKVSRPRRKLRRHLIDGCPHDSGCCATPPRMNRRDSAGPRVRQQQWHAVRHLHAQRD